ncbi:putative serine threonine protein kinase domain protein [Erysiphe necator]|uniref:Putative serine threonine protein kinase domain protein n=1 Tax=Uncinula necator TaxID=52586 RepID=A0A0B1P167_UNCNE|nr:putative serine threonine protein kinase domain protein [Erysiphe necator]
MWTSWWAAKLRNSAPHVRTSPSDSPKDILTAIVLTSQAQAHNNIITLTSKCWLFQPNKNTTLQGSIKEYQRKYHDLKEHSTFSSERKS